MRITAQTTLGELMLERAKLGITYMSSTVVGAERYVLVEAPLGIAYGRGLTEAEAIKDAFDRIRLLERLGAS